MGGGRLAVEVGAAHVGEHRTRPVVDGHDGVVVDVAALQLFDPAQRRLAVLGGQLLVGEAIHVVADLRPLLRGGLVAVVVEGGDDVEPAGVEQLLALEQLVRLAAHGLHEVRRQVGGVTRRRELDLFGQGLVVFGLGDEVGLEHLLQHDVAGVDGLGRLRHHVAHLVAGVLLHRLRRRIQA